MDEEPKRNLLHWFRKGLRLHDNPSLREALDGASSFRFLLQCLEDLDSSLRKLNSRLYVVRGQPEDVFPKLFKRKIISENDGTPPLTFKRFQSVLSRLDPPAKPEDRITLDTICQCKTPTLLAHDDKYGIPSLDDLGFDTSGLSSNVFRGGESEALQRLQGHLQRKAWVASYEKSKMTSQSLFPSQTTLSPYLSFGCISPRLFYWKLHELYRKIKKQNDPPLSLHGQLLWREFFFTAATNNPSFDKMEGNAICIQVPWDKNPEALANWAEGKTGFPWIDAIMVQLREVGWVHHLGRHAIACFLTRGDLWISWEEGFKVFDELLMDADWSVNAGMWLWLSCSSFFQQFLNCYCPVGFGKQADPTGDFIRHYLPVLKAFPAQYIYEPWNAPESVQVAAKCIVGKDYPVPMVNHAEASKLCMKRMKQVYQMLLKMRAKVQLPKQIAYKATEQEVSEDKPTRDNHQSKADIIPNVEDVFSSGSESDG
ncbi:cryptochrome-1-like [Dreissena polymorpha]|uniref:cryptochrome-1-like n=1 Tax=Dreissena polymorpha TaxID=45954 RepID=UPI002264F6F5|nr:cryptochrome-1-like [Dreissena polymorpha]